MDRADLYTFVRHGIPPIWGYYSIEYDGTPILVASTYEEASRTVNLLKSVFRFGYMYGQADQADEVIIKLKEAVAKTYGK